MVNVKVTIQTAGCKCLTSTSIDLPYFKSLYMPLVLQCIGCVYLCFEFQISTLGY